MGLTKEERRAKREQRRNQRQALKTLRKAKFQEFIEKVKEGPDMPEDGDTPDYVTKFNTYWPIVKAGLSFAESMKLTGKKLDKNIREVILLGDDVANNPGAESEFQEKLAHCWKFIRIALIALTVFVTNDEQDEKIEKFIEIGDWLSGEEEDHD